MPITPAPPYPKATGQTIRAADWNQTVDEVIRLDNSKVNRAGDRITGSLTVDVALGIGTAAPTRPLTIQNAAGAFLNVRGTNGTQEFLAGADATGGVVATMTVHDLQLRTNNINRLIVKAAGNVGIGVDNPLATLHVGTQLNVGTISSGPLAVGRVEVSGPGGELSLIRRTLAAWPAAPAKGDRFVWYNPNGRCQLWTEGDILTVASNGDVSLTGKLTIPKTASGSATFSNALYTNEASLQPNNLKLEMAHTGLIIFGGPTLTYEFAIGHTFSSFIIGGGGGTSFVKRFGINQNGDLFCSGSKAGYVVDFFINRVGDTLEQGDVVVVGKNPKMQFYGSNNDIPIPEVDLTDRVHDTRVCGIVAKFVSEADLPSVDPPLLTEEQAKKLKKPVENPLRALAARPNQKDPTKVLDQQLGKMATLGAYAYCKVDADIAPILAGDLLTTSPTKGHAQKVLDPVKAIGAIIGKALSPLKKGKGKIPVIVTLQ